MVSFDAAPSNPLPFASTLQSLDPNVPDLAASISSLGIGKPPKIRQYDNPLPARFPEPIWTRHSRAGSINTPAPAIGSDEWMDAQLQSCIDKADMMLHLK